ncbi:MAG: hypothetical protein K6F21_06050 [Bacteroidales bacterium]|nr:hypothetical protein [Bacteroidales bacterium]
MKKFIIFIALAIVAFAVSCQKDPIEKTATVDLAGQWYIIYNCVDANGDIVPGFEDFNGGYSMAITFNTASNTTDSIFVSDLDNLLGFQVKVACDVANLTFGSTNEEANIMTDGTGIKKGYIDSTAVIKNGKIMLGAATTPSGMPADSIYFEVSLGSDAMAAYYGYDHYQAVGYRYTGLANDD